LKDATNKNKKEVVVMVKDWLEEEDLSIEYLDDVDTDVKCVVNKDNMILNVGFLKASKDSLIISGKVGLESYQQEMLGLTKTKREMLFDLELVFLQVNLDFTVDVNADAPLGVSISDIQIHKTVF
jgi:hypothetical protein